MIVGGLNEEQMAMRQHTLGASEIAAVCGLNPWKSAHDVWLVKRGLADEAGSVRTRMGLRVEAAVAEEYCETEGARIAHFGTIVHPSEPWMAATPDACVFGASRLLEIKCVGWRIAHHWGTQPDEIPDYYRPQAEWQMLVTGAEECHVAAWIGGSDFRIYPIKRDRELGAMLQQIARKFWFENVMKGEPPPVDGSEGARRMLAKLFPRNVANLRQSTPDLDHLAKQLAEARAAVKLAEKIEAELENKMCSAISDAEGIAGEKWRATWRADKKGTRRFLFKAPEAA